MRRGPTTIALALLAALAPAPAGAFQRPTDPQPGVYGQPPYAVPEAPPACTAQVCVHYVATTADAPPSMTDADADAVPDSIEVLRDEADVALTRSRDLVG